MCIRDRYNVLQCTWVSHITLNIHGKLTDDFLYCTARHVRKQRTLCPITINTWDQFSNDGKALFEELRLDKTPAVTLNVCEVHVPLDESCDNKTVSINNPASLITLLEGEEKTGKENLRVRINVQSDDSTCGDSDDSTGRSWNDSLLLGLARNCTLTSLNLTISNFSPRSTKLSLTLIGCLEGCSSLNSLTLTLNEYNEWRKSYPYLLCKGLGRNTSLVSLILTLNIYTRVREVPDDIYNFQCDGFYVGCFVPNISINSFTLTINDFSSGGLGGGSDVLLSYYKSLTTFCVTLNHCSVESFSGLPLLFVEWMKPNSLTTLRLKINDLKYRIGYREYDFSDWVVKIPSLELVELTIIRYGVLGSCVETLKWEKQ